MLLSVALLNFAQLWVFDVISKAPQKAETNRVASLMATTPLSMLTHTRGSQHKETGGGQHCSTPLAVKTAV
jgi:hypothetical protein